MLGKKLILLSFCGFLVIDAFAQRDKDTEVDVAGLPRPDFSTSANESGDDEGDGRFEDDHVNNVALGRQSSYRRRYGENYDGVRGDQDLRRLLNLIRRCDPRANEEAEHLLEQRPELLNRHGGRHGVTPLHVAASSGNLTMVYLLLALRADVNARTTNSGYLPVHGAIMHGDSEIAKTLLLNGTDLDDIGPDGDLVETARFYRQKGIAHFVKVMREVEAKRHGGHVQNKTSDGESTVTSSSSSSSSSTSSSSSSDSEYNYNSSISSDSGSESSDGDTEEIYFKARPEKGQLQIACRSAQFSKTWKQTQEQEKKNREQAERAKKQAEEIAVLSQVANFFNAISSMSAMVPEPNKVPTKTETVPPSTEKSTDPVIPDFASDMGRTLDALDAIVNAKTEGSNGEAEEDFVAGKSEKESLNPVLEEEIEKLLKIVTEDDFPKNHSDGEVQENKIQDE